MNAETAIAQTVAAQMAQPDGGEDQPVPGTPEQEMVTISVSVDTNCRSGPDGVYDKLGVLMAGETAEVVGKRAVADYWVIQNPDGPGTCWLWGMYATLQGNTDLIPEMTPPPTPTVIEVPTEEPYADFTAFFFGLCNNDGDIWLNIQVTNTGNVDLESAHQRVVDTTSNTTLYGPGDSNSPFRATVACSDQTLVGALPHGNTAFLKVKLNSAISGHTAVYSVTLCSQDGNTGLCVSKQVNFVIP